MARLSTELKSVQNPFIKYAKKMGWKYISPEDALSYRQGEQGKFFYDVLEKKACSIK